MGGCSVVGPGGVVGTFLVPLVEISDFLKTDVRDVSSFTETPDASSPPPFPPTPHPLVTKARELWRTKTKRPSTKCSTAFLRTYKSSPHTILTIGLLHRYLDGQGKGGREDGREDRERVQNRR